MMRRWLIATILVAMAAGCEHEDTGAPQAAAPIQVRITAVRRDDISEVLNVTGETAALTVLRLASPVAGRVTLLAARAGDALDQDAVAARVLPLENEAAQHGFAILEDTAGLPPAERHLARQLRQDLPMHDIALHVPFASVVAERMHNPGEQIGQNEVLLELFDPRSLYVLAQVPAESAARVNAGQPVEIRGSGMSAAGQVSALLTTLTPQSLTLPVRISLTTPLQRPLLNAAVQCRITLARHTDALLIPRSALISSLVEDHGTVMIAVAGQAQQRTIGLGLRTQTDVEVTGGLVAGDAVLIDGQYSLPDGTAIAPVAAN